MNTASGYQGRLLQACHLTNYIQSPSHPAWKKQINRGNAWEDGEGKNRKDTKHASGLRNNYTRDIIQEKSAFGEWKSGRTRSQLAIDWRSPGSAAATFLSPRQARQLA